MEESILEEKIKCYCKKCKMKMDELSIITTNDGFLAKDNNTSIMFDKEGNVSSIPTYALYGRKTTQFIGKTYAAIMYGAIIFVVIVLVIGTFLK